MKYNKKIRLKNNKECCLRNGNENDGQSVFENFNLYNYSSNFPHFIGFPACPLVK